MNTKPVDAHEHPEQEAPEAYEPPCIEDVDTESQPAATAAMIQTNPG